jgi:hypothetical protein
MPQVMATMTAAIASTVVEVVAALLSQQELWA